MAAIESIGEAKFHLPKLSFKFLRTTTGLIFLLLGAVILWFASGALVKPIASIPVVQKSALFRVEITNSKAVSQFREIVTRGNVSANRSVPLYAQGAGYIVEIPHPKGSYVKKDDILIRLADQDVPAKLKSAQTVLEQRNLEYKAALELTHKSFGSEVSLAQAKTNLDTALANVRTAEQNMQNLLIRAPFDGIFNSTDLDVGGMVGSALMLGATVGTIIDIDTIKAVLQIPEKDAMYLKIGEDAFLTFPYADNLEFKEPLKGKISYISKSADPKLKTYRVEIRAKNIDHKIYEGMTIEAKIPLKEIGAHLVNFSLLTLDELGHVGMKIVNDKSETVFYPVTPLKMENGKVWVSGLPNECRIISMGQDFVASGEKVEALPIKLEK